MDSAAPRIAFVFVDGLGLGEATPNNPLSTLELSAFRRLAGGQPWVADSQPVREPHLTFAPLDATLGVEGLPQSGTGQVALFAGVNAAHILGRHYGPVPPTDARDDLAAESLFARLRRQGASAEDLAFVNPFPEAFFAKRKRRPRWTATPLMARQAGVRLRRGTDLLTDRAVAPDLTRAGWNARFMPKARPITETEAGQHFATLAQAHHLTLLEMFATDKAGHAQNAEAAARILIGLDRFLAALLESLAPDLDLLLLSSDHGNVEDLTVKTHTRNPVPLIAWGHRADAFAEATSVLDVAPLVENVCAPR